MIFFKNFFFFFETIIIIIHICNLGFSPSRRFSSGLWPRRRVVRRRRKSLSASRRLVSKIRPWGSNKTTRTEGPPSTFPIYKCPIHNIYKYIYAYISHQELQWKNDIKSVISYRLRTLPEKANCTWNPVSFECLKNRRKNTWALNSRQPTPKRLRFSTHREPNLRGKKYVKMVQKSAFTRSYRWSVVYPEKNGPGGCNLSGNVFNIHFFFFRKTTLV